MSSKHQKVIAAALAAFSMLLAAPPGLAQPVAGIDGVVEVGTIDPWSESSAGSGGSAHGEESAGSSGSSSCIIPDPFGGPCLFTYTESSEFEHLDEGQDTWYWYASEDSTMSGYYVEIMDGVVFARASAGALESASGSGSSGGLEQHDREAYENNLGWSEESEDSRSMSWDDAESSYRSVDKLLLEAGIDVPIAHADLVLDREANGAEGSTESSEGSGSNATSQELIGIPIYGETDEQSHFLTGESATFWNRTLAGGTIYLLDPRDGSRVDVVGLALDRGDESGSGSEEHASSSGETTSVFGMTVYDHQTSDSGESEYSFFREWLHLSVDLVEGTVSGDVAYDHGESTGSSSGSTSDEYDILGVPVFGEAHEAESEASNEWRDVTFGLDAADGVATLQLGSWDDSSQAHDAYEDTYTIVGLPVGMGGESDSSFHSDGIGFGLELAQGLVWFGARYENTSSSERSYDDVLLDHEALVGMSEEDSSSSRGIFVDAGTSIVPVSVGAHHANESSHSGDFVRLGGEDFAGITSDDEHAEYGAGADAAGIFVFEFLYEDGHSDDALVLAGMPLGVRDEYEHLKVGASGDVVAPTGQHVFSYSFEHEETSDDYELYADDATIGGLEHNVTSDRLSILVLDGAAGAHAERTFSNDRVVAGDDTEVAELGLQQVDVGAEHGSVGPAGVGPGGAGVSVFLAYVEAADAFALMAGVATWCVDPGVPIPYGTVLGAMPPDLQTVGATAIQAAALLTCFGAPVLVPLFAASPCIVIPLAAGTVFLTAGVVTSLLPAGSEVVGAAEGAFWETYGGSAVNCVWLTVPDAARNPQPVIGALAIVNDGVDAGLARVWPAYDEGRTTAWGVLDMAFGADHGAPMPEGLSLPPLPTV